MTYLADTIGALSLHGGAISTGLLGLIVGVTLIIALMLYYHWVRYGVGILGTFAVMISYAAGTAVLLLAALGVYAQL